MENLKTFESHSWDTYYQDKPTKNYGEYYPLDQVKPGDQILYMGTKFNVISSDEYSIEVEDGNGNTKRINQAMFTKGGYISKNKSNG